MILLSAFADGEVRVGHILRHQPGWQSRSSFWRIPLRHRPIARHRATYEAWLESHTSHFEVLPVTEETAVTYAGLRVSLKRSGRPIPANDAWIAALALQHRIPILSRDEHFDVIAGPRRESW